MLRMDFQLYLRALLSAALLLPGAPALAADTTPDPIVFPAVSNAEPGSTVISASQTITGIDSSVPISITGGLYSINGGAFTSASGTVSNGSSVRVQEEASTAFYTSTSTYLRLGSPAATYAFKVSTRKIDTMPDAFVFEPRVDAALGSAQTSEPATISGLEAAAAITVSNGAYSINGGEFTTAAGTVANNAQVRARGVAGSGVNQSTTVAVKIGGVTGSFKITTIKTVDTTPNAFGFAPTTNATPGSVQTSAAIVVGGINADAPISVTGGTYSINGQAFTNAAGTVNNGDSVRVQQTASSSLSTTTTAVLKIGTVSGSYAVTTGTADTTPDAFGFPAVVDAPLDSLQTSAPITVSGISAAAPVSVSGGQYSVNGQAFGDASSTVNNGDKLRLRQVSSSQFSTTTTAVLTIGGVAGSWELSTAAIDDSPDPLLFEEQKNVAPGRPVISNAVTVSGINTAVAVSVTGGSYSVDGGAWTTTPGSVSNGAQIRLQLLASNNFGSATEAVLSVAGIKVPFRIAAVPLEKSKDTLIFASVAGVAPGTFVTSNAVVVAGLNPDAPITVAGVGGSYSIDGGPFTIEDGVINNGSSLRLRLAITSPATTATVAVFVGDKTGSFSLSSATPDTTPNAFSFTAGTGSDINADKTKGFTVRGINAATPVSIEGGSYQIGDGPFTSAPGLVNEGQVITVSLRTAPTYSTTTGLRLTVGGVKGIFSIATSSLPKPLIEPLNGVYATPQTITISVPDGIPAGATLYYTTDRSTPSLASTPYTGPFVFSGHGLVRAALLKADGSAVGPISTRDYQIYAIGNAAPVYVSGGTDLGRWKISLPIGRFARPFETAPPFLQGFASPPYFQPNPDGSVDFASPVTGLHSPGSDFPRSELREMNADTSFASWHVGDAAQSLSAVLTVTQAPSTGRIVIGQIHADDEGPVLVLVEWRGLQGEPGALYLSIRIHPDDAGRPTVLVGDIPWGSLLTYRIDVALDGVLTVTANGKVASVQLDPEWTREGLYFKAGTYVLDNEGNASEGGAARFYGIQLGAGY